jgi:hypothetical protein
MVLEYRNRQYEIDGTWNGENEMLSVWFPLKPIPDEQWEQREEALRAYIGHRMGERATISALELLETDLPNIPSLSPPSNPLAVLQAQYQPRAIEEFFQLASCGYAAFGMLPPSPELMLRQDIQRHALSSAGRGIELTFRGFLLLRSAADAAPKAA